MFIIIFFANFYYLWVYDTIKSGNDTVNLADDIVNLKNDTVNSDDDPINLEEIIFRLIVNKEGLAAPEISKLIEKSIITTKRYLAKLKETQKIEFRGAPKTGGYYLKLKNEWRDTYIF